MRDARRAPSRLESVDVMLSFDDSPTTSGFQITPSDTEYLPGPIKALRVGFAGNIRFVSLEGNVCEFPGARGGEIIPVGMLRVLASGTTAGALFGYGLADAGLQRQPAPPIAPPVEPLEIELSALTIPEDAEEDEVIGTASISGSYTGTPEWSLSGDDTDKVQINSSTGVYSVAGALDFETQPTLNVVFEVTGVDPAVPNKPAAISVTNVLEVTLNALTLDTDEIESGAAENTVVGALQNVSSGSSLSLTDSSGNQFKLSGSNIVAGPVPTDFGTKDDPTITVRETHANGSNSPRDSIIGITVTEEGGEFAPTDIANCAVWLDAADTATITSGSGLVSAWANKANGSNNATQGTGTNQPTTGTRTINSLNTIDFDGGDNFVALASAISRTNGYTVFAVVEYDTISSDVTHGSPIIIAGATGSAGFRVSGTSLALQVIRTNQASILTGPTVSLNTPLIGVWQTIDAGGSSVNRAYLNGGTASSNTTDPNYTQDLGTKIGSGPTTNFTDGKLAELIIYTDVLDASELNQVGEYLSDKWGIAWSTVS